MKLELPELPYQKHELNPYISEKTIQFHYGKHHNAYVGNTKKLIAGTDLEDKILKEIITTAYNEQMVSIFNNAAQVWNHSFYWNCMKPEGGGNPSGIIKDKINDKFGNYNEFKSQFKNAAMTQFGSGWAWLVLNDNNTLDIRKTPNADTPLRYNCKPLLTVDVWEHAYYLDYQNKRADYLDAFLDHLINWDFVNSKL
jgi:Fe-Mn family superoxide dismutase